MKSKPKKPKNEIYNAVQKNIDMMGESKSIFDFDPFTNWYIEEQSKNQNRKNDNDKVSLKNLLEKIDNLEQRARKK